MSYCRFTLVFVFLIPQVLGCGGPKGPLRVPVEGTVTIDGAPLTAAVVEYIPISQVAGNGGHGRTDSSGWYEVTTWQGKEGLPPGDYKVVIEKRVMPDGSDFPFHADEWPRKDETRQILPGRFAGRKESELKATVTEEEAEYNFALDGSG